MHTPRPTGPAISVEDLKTRLYIFADDSMLGRAAGTIGNVRATDYLAAEVKRLGLQPAGDSGTYFQTLRADPKGQPLPHPSRNVVAILPGSDPGLRHQYIVLGAHSDHNGAGGPAVDHDSLHVYNHFMRPRGASTILREMFGGQRNVPTDGDWRAITAELAKLRRLNPPRPDSIQNGADDDGSGSVALLEIAQAMAAADVRPKRSLLFVWHTGEEQGMWGSRLLVDQPPVPLDSLVAELNADMIGRGEASDHIGGGPRSLQFFRSGCLAAVLDTLLDNVNRRGHGLQLAESPRSESVGRGRLSYKSDYVSYAAKGITFAHFTTSLHPDYHQVTDEPQYINYEHLARITNFIRDVAIQLANHDRPLICRSVQHD